MTTRKMGALAILIPIIVGIVGIWSSMATAIIRWNFVETKVKEHEEKLHNISDLYKLNCAMAIEVIKSKSKVQEFCK